MRVVLTISLIVMSFSVCAQEIPVQTENQLENLPEESQDDDAWLQQLVYYQRSPLNLNVATATELTLLRLLNDWQIESLLKHRAVLGPLLSIYELQAVPGFDVATIQKIIPFIKVGEARVQKESLSFRMRSGRYMALFRASRYLEKQAGYDTSRKSHYLGDRNRLQFRLQYQYKTLLYYGLLGDKDAGEPFFRGAQKAGFDFYSGHFFVRNLGRLKVLALGDYAVNLGQGLISWQSLAFGKSAEVINIKRQLPALTPYRAAGEFYFSRGIGATVQLGAWEATGFFSYKKISGNRVLDSAAHFTSFATSGLYRTQSEIDDRYQLTHFSTGGRLAFHTPGMNIGLNSVVHRFSLPIHKQNEPYNRFALSGRVHFLSSIDYSYTYKNVHVYGEWAGDRHAHLALVQGALLSVDPKMDISFLYRRIAKAYQSPFGNAFAESTLPSNEYGGYTGIQLRPLRGWQILAYADFYRFPFIRYRVSAPARGWDYLAQVSYAPDKETLVYVRYRTDSKPVNRVGGIISYPAAAYKTNIRVHFATRLSNTTIVKARTELVWYQKATEQREEGWMTYIECASLVAKKIHANLRLQYFETGGYNSRIYALETEVLYSFSVPALFDKGVRWFLVLNTAINQRFRCWVRMAQTVYPGKTSIGSGLETAMGNRKTELKIQVTAAF